MKIDLSSYIELLSKRATDSNIGTPDSALKFSQAALNLARTMAMVENIKQE
jgi:hypothetical protein